ncbi:HDOD domain-containing protein [Marinobacteraceae bacterium S3BR75-40.1]
MTDQAPASKEDWTAYLSSVELPVLAQTLQQISELTDSNSSTVNQLADVILKDADLTSQVLKLSNTVFYNQSRMPVSTVSRAITLIGFDSVRAMAISSLVIDSLLTKNPRSRLLQCLARALHAGVQARCLLPQNNQHKREEVFIGALLSEIGEMAFWACRAPEADRLDEAFHRLEPQEAQREVLGTTFKSINRGLADAWSLGPFLKDVVSAGKPRSESVAMVRHAHTLVAAAEKGWNNPDVEAALKDLAVDTKKKVEDLRKEVRENAREAAKVAVDYGLNQITSLLPDEDSVPIEGEPRPNAGDPMLQLQILRELSALITEKPDLNLVFQTVVEGIQRAVGMQRCALLMRDRNTARLIPRKLLGPGTEHWRETFQVDLSSDSFIAQIASQGRCVQFNGASDKDAPTGSLPSFDRHIGRKPGLFGPLYVGKRVVGLVYADNGDLFVSPSDEQYLGFSHFVQQAQLCLNNLAERKG